MSVVIIGGHDRMVRQYKEICENHKYKAKVFTQMKTGLDKLIGSSDPVYKYGIPQDGTLRIGRGG